MSLKNLPHANISDIEEQTLAFWRDRDIFTKSLEKTKDGKLFSFYDGPPFANGLPHFGHSLVTSIKDAIGRYKTMQGYYVERRNGWDCHGLPVEFEIEKKFNVSGKKQILELGLEKFNAACRESVFTYKAEWEQFFERIGRWTDTEHSYATIDNSFIESVWWALGQVHEKNLLYKGYKSMPYCPRCETPLSNFELNEGYKEGVTDPSLYVKFKLVDEDAHLLAWTTTPWSLPGNAAIAVAPDETYVKVQVDDKESGSAQLILAQKRLEVLAEAYTVIDKFPGKDLVGKQYQPLFVSDKTSDNLYRVWAADFVSIEDGTGVLHVAPAFGEDDLNLAREHNIPILTTIDSSGKLTKITDIKELEGMFFKKADAHIIEHLENQHMVFAAETLEHIYPFCYRCDSPLLYYAISTWFVKVSDIREDLLHTAESIDWVPAHVKTGRFGKWLEGARDWAISRNRYWGSPLPIWVNEADESDYIVITSVEEMKKLAVKMPDTDDLHRPYIDEVVLERDGKTYRRVEEVLDCWFESGSMPYGSKHYPFKNSQSFADSFPADYIGEGLDQTRLWFYVLHVLSTVLFDQPAYKNVIVNGMIMAADGQKLSKRLKNYPPIEDVFGKEGADSLRYYLLSSPATVGEYMRFSRDGLTDVSRNIFMTLYNSASFFSMYASVDNWQPQGLGRPQQVSNPLDVWLLARLDVTLEQVTTAADSYDLGRATRPLADLVDDLSNWYIRKSRRRFWKSESDTDKAEAYNTLYFVLTTICKMFAPWTPFMGDYLWRHLTEGVEGAEESVHLCAWPVSAPYDAAVLESMSMVRRLVTDGLSQRGIAKIKVRQPLAKLTYSLEAQLDANLEELVADEVNVKQLNFAKGEFAVQLDTKITDELELEGLARDIIRQIQQARKQAGFAVDDRIQVLYKSSDAKIVAAFTKFHDLIATEVLAREMGTDADANYDTTVTMGDAELSLKLTVV